MFERDLPLSVALAGVTAQGPVRTILSVLDPTSFPPYRSYFVDNNARNVTVQWHCCIIEQSLISASYPLESSYCNLVSGLLFILLALLYCPLH